jgi:pimeloyl-ACP methyl ester carboxylesterase
MLGFGASDRPAIRYTPALYQQLLLDFVTHVAGAADQPVHVIASRHSAAFLLRAAAERPHLFERLVLIEPAGITTRRVLGTPAMREMALRLLHAPVPGLMAYDLLASRPGMRYFLRMAYKRPSAVTRAVVSAHRREALRRGARFAPACYLTGMLDTTSREALVRLRLPILLAWGRHARLMPVEHIPLWLRIYPRADLRLFNAGDFPHSETADDFLRAVSTWLGEPLATRQA